MQTDAYTREKIRNKIHTHIQKKIEFSETDSPRCQRNKGFTYPRFKSRTVPTSLLFQKTHTICMCDCGIGKLHISKQLH